MKVQITAAQARRGEATLGQARFRMSEQSFAILLFLYLQRPGRPVPCREIADALAGEDGGADTFETLIADRLWAFRDFGFPIAKNHSRGWTIEGASRGRDGSNPLPLFRLKIGRDLLFHARFF